VTGAGGRSQLVALARTKLGDLSDDDLAAIEAISDPRILTELVTSLGRVRSAARARAALDPVGGGRSPAPGRRRGGRARPAAVQSLRQAPRESSRGRLGRPLNFNRDRDYAGLLRTIRAATMPLVQQPLPTQINHDPEETEDVGPAVESVVETQFPLDIRKSDFSIYELHHRWRAGFVRLQPEFQREMVWTEDKQIKFVESVLARIPLPVIYHPHEGARRTELRHHRAQDAPPVRADAAHLLRAPGEHIAPGEVPDLRAHQRRHDAPQPARDS